MREEVASPSPVENRGHPTKDGRDGLATPIFEPENRLNSFSETLSLCL